MIAASPSNATLSELVGEIDSNRQQGNLSSAIRLFVPGYFRTRCVRRIGFKAAGMAARPRSPSF